MQFNPVGGAPIKFLNYSRPAYATTTLYLSFSKIKTADFGAFKYIIHQTTHLILQRIKTEKKTGYSNFSYI